MLQKLLLLLLLFQHCTCSSQEYKKLHEKALVVDTHNDVMISMLEGLDLAKDLTGKTHSDLNRFKRGGVDVQIFSIWSDERYEKGKGFNYANRQIDSLYAVVQRNPDKMMIVKTTQQLKEAVRQQKLGAMIGLEGGHMIEDSIDYLNRLYERGVRYMTLTWNNSTSWASSAKDEEDHPKPHEGRALKDSSKRAGLTPFGKQVVRRMNELGMLVDLSHVGEKTFWDVMEITTKPVIVSHSCVYAITPHRRNLKDEQIKAVAKNGGVIHLNFYSGFLDSNYEKRKEVFIKKNAAQIDSLKKLKWQSFEIDFWMARRHPADMQALRPPISALLDHLDYIVKLVGVDHVGLGSDFDGVESTPLQLDDVADMPNITKALLERGYKKRDIKKIVGGNFLRIFRAAQANISN
jgi:membrane dipeptidase